jgi:hypothetical protein
MSDLRPGGLPVFSQRLDEIMAAMIKGEIPNVGRFCGYCYTPVTKNATSCTHCGRSVSEWPTVAKIPTDLFDVYRRMRKRESLIVNSFAFAGLALGLLLFIGLVALAVYRYNANLWLLAFATGAFIVGGRIFAGILGGWIGDNIGYDYAQKKLALEWAEYEQRRDGNGSAQQPLVTPASADA